MLSSVMAGLSENDPHPKPAPYSVYTHELVVRAQQLDSVAQLVRVLLRNRRAAGSIPARGPIVAFFATAPG